MCMNELLWPKVKCDFPRNCKMCVSCRLFISDSIWSAVVIFCIVSLEQNVAAVYAIFILSNLTSAVVWSKGMRWFCCYKRLFAEIMKQRRCKAFFWLMIDLLWFNFLVHDDAGVLCPNFSVATWIMEFSLISFLVSEAFIE